MRSNYIYYVVIIALSLIIILKYGISKPSMESTDISNIKKCKSYIEISQKKLDVDWKITFSQNKINVSKLIPSSANPKIKWLIYNEVGDLIYEDIVKHKYLFPENIFAFNKQFGAHELNWVDSKALELDLLNNISVVELYEIEMGCSVYESTAEQKTRITNQKEREKIEYNCFIKNYSADRDDGYTRRAAQSFCELISKDPSLFQYINYYYF